MQRLALLLAATLALHNVASAQEETDLRDFLYATYELHEGGDPLDRQLFAKAWPTTKRYRNMTSTLAGDPARELARAYLASASGPSLANSQWALDRKELRNKEGDKHDDTRALLGSELLLLRFMAGNRDDSEGMAPTLYPLTSVQRSYARGFNERRLGTWAWKGATGKATLDGLGLALLLETRYGIEQLKKTREVQQAGKAFTLRGDNKDDGFFGLLALQNAGAKVIELRRRLVYDSRKQEILRQESLLELDARRYYFPSEWSVSVDGEILAYKDANPTSLLRAQSYVLLGASRLATELMTGDEEVKGALKPITVRGQKIFLVDPEARDAALDVAIFAFRSILALHVSLASGASAASEASPREQGMTVTPRDFSVFMQALEAFLRIPAGTRGLGRNWGEALTKEQGKATKLAGALVKNLVAWVRADARGVYDKYDTGTNSRANGNRSLASQAFAIQGLVAGHGMVGSSEALQAARELTAKLDEHYWDAKANAFTSGGRKGTRAEDAAAVLGALRRVALATGDGRYIFRYRQYLAFLNEAGWFKAGSSNAPPGFAAEIDLAQK